MSKILFITGGQRSGKSSYAQRLALSLSENPIYLATARIWDSEFKARVQRHQSDRNEQWTTIEEEKYISQIDVLNRVVVLDCITLWLTNFFHDNNYAFEPTFEAVIKEWDKFIEQDSTLIVVSNEIGMGLHPLEESVRKFADLQGWVNQHIAQQAQQVILMVSGIPLIIK